MTHKLFSELGLSSEVLKAIDKLGFEQASPIQAEAIPAILSGRDVVGQSQTGSGKTAAFGIPAIERTEPGLGVVQVLVLCPTRELAVQVSEEVHKLALFKRGIRALPIYGGQSYERQFQGLKDGAQIVIGTPGRVMDHMRRGTLRLDAVKLVILDEVDVMLNMGFREDIELILQSTPAARQTVFFSATIPRPIQELIRKHAREPQQIRIEQKVLTVPTVEQVYYEVDRRFKIELLTRLIDLHDYKLGIIFCNTKRMVDDLVDHLNAQGYSADRLHGDMGQQLRDRVMNRFRRSGLEFLVATDVAARGIDVDDVQVVVNYDLPYDAEDYLHRIGRTGRAGRSGCAISFASGRELFQIQLIERYTKTRIHRAKPPTANEVQAARANVFLGRLRATLVGGEFEPQDELIGRLLEEGFTSTDIASALIHQLKQPDLAGGGSGVKDSSGENSLPPRARDERPQVRRPEREPGPTRSDRWESRPGRGGISRPGPGPSPDFVRRPQSDPPRANSGARLKPTPKREEMPRSGTKAGHYASAPGGSPKRERPDLGTAESRKAPAPRVKSAVQPWAQQAPHTRRGHSGNHTRLYMNVGTEMGVAAGDVVGAILGETGLPAQAVGKVDLRERHLFVDVDSVQANSIIAKLNRTSIKGHHIKVKLA